MRKIVGVGETILDILFKDSQPLKAVPGGSVFNGLISLGRVGLNVSFISEIGNDKVGSIIKSFLEENNISTEYINIFPDGKSPISLAFLDENNDAQYTFYKDYPNQRLDVKLPEINEDDILVFGSYYALNPALRPRIVELLEYAKERKAIIYYDVNFRSSHKHEAIKLNSTIIENLEYADIVRGSGEDFENMYNGMGDVDKVYKEKIKFYCPNFICTSGGENINLRTQNVTRSYQTTPIKAVSTIGAGDNFNAGIIYGLIKYGVKHEDLNNIDEEKWNKIIACAKAFATEVCISLNNSVSKEFAEKYKL